MIRASAQSPISVLLVEDNEGDARLIRELLGGAGAADCLQLRPVIRLADALAELQHGDVDLVLLDPQLPDSHGLGSVQTLQQAAANVPLIVMTEAEDADLASTALQMGAQDYLVKGDLSPDLLFRAIRYAIERHALVIELEATRRRERQERELHDLEMLSGSPTGQITARLFGLKPLRHAAPEFFNELVDAYARIIDLALERKAYKVEYDLSGRLRDLAARLASFSAGPRDVIELHVATLRRLASDANGPRSQSYTEEGRLLVLELMGYLVNHYRTLYMRSAGRKPSEGDTAGADHLSYGGTS